MLHWGPIRPRLSDRRPETVRLVDLWITRAAVAAAAMLPAGGLVDSIVAVIAILLIPPAVEMMIGNAGRARLAFSEAFPEPEAPRSEEELAMLATAGPRHEGTGGCDRPRVLAPGRRSARRGGDKRL